MGVPDADPTIFTNGEIQWGPPLLFPMGVIERKVKFSLGKQAFAREREQRGGNANVRTLVCDPRVLTNVSKWADRARFLRRSECKR